MFFYFFGKGTKGYIKKAIPFHTKQQIKKLFPTFSFSKPGDQMPDMAILL
jgi:hypothetical protein